MRIFQILLLCLCSSLAYSSDSEPSALQKITALLKKLNGLKQADLTFADETAKAKFVANLQELRLAQRKLKLGIMQEMQQSLAQRASMSARERFIYAQIEKKPSAVFTDHHCEDNMTTVGEFLSVFKANPQMQRVGFYEGRFVLSLSFSDHSYITHYSLDANDWVNFNDTLCISVP